MEPDANSCTICQSSSRFHLRWMSSLTTSNQLRPRRAAKCQSRPPQTKEASATSKPSPPSKPPTWSTETPLCTTSTWVCRSTRRNRKCTKRRLQRSTRILRSTHLSSSTPTSTSPLSRDSQSLQTLLLNQKKRMTASMEMPQPTSITLPTSSEMWTRWSHRDQFSLSIFNTSQSSSLFKCHSCPSNQLRALRHLLWA